MLTTVYTIGHSNRSAEELLAILTSAAIAALVDVRLRPASRRNPQFNQAQLRTSLQAAGLAYHWAGRGLGGMRKPRADSPHLAFAGTGLQGYADYMADERFVHAARRLEQLAANQPTVAMCAERSPLDCHRSLIADWLTLRGRRVVHLGGADRTSEHQLRPEARRGCVELIYDRGAQGRLL